MARDTIRIGFMPLADAAIPLVAARLDFARQWDLNLEMVRETSWANIRDRLAVGHFDAAHLLAPMPIATVLGLMPVQVPLIAPMALGLGGNAITVSQALWAEMQQALPEVAIGDPVSTGAALRRVAADRRRSGRPVPGFAVVHAFSAHNYELRYWLAASGLAPDADVDIGIISPPFMPAALQKGGIDGFCVGEPWNTLATSEGSGIVLLRKTDIWRASPEKVLSLRADWAAAHPEMLTRLLALMLDAAEWCAEPANRTDLADILASPDALGMPAATLLPVLQQGLEFARNAATFPWRSHARWFAGEMVRWKQGHADAAMLARATNAYRPDLYRAAAALKGLNVPAVDDQPEDGADACEIPGTLAPLRLEPSRFFDR